MHLSIKKITKIIRGRNGNTIEPNPDGSVNVVIVSPPTELVDVSSIDWVNVPPDDSYHEICKYTLNSGETIYIKQLTLALVGMMAQFRLRVHTQTDDFPRRYTLSTQQNTFSETIEKPIPVVYEAGSYISVEAKMLGVNQQGQAFAALNCYK